MFILDNYKRLKEEIAETAVTHHRKPEEIKLLVISKGQPFESIASIYEAGCRDFGENRLQEALSKIEQCPADIQWHFVGSLQKSKVRKTLGPFAMIHSVDSVELARKISEVSVERNYKTTILLQVNTSGEPTKHGMTPDDCLQDFRYLRSLPGLDIKGLMTMAPFIEDENMIRSTFANLRILKEKIISKCQLPNGLPELSMGMSHDFKLAIAEGATILRIGTKIWNL